LTELKRNTALTVGTDLVMVSAAIAQGQRTVISLTNVSTGAQVISVSVGAQAAAGGSIVLHSGASWVESIDSAFRPTNDEITAIASAAGGSLAIHERIAGTGL